MYTQLKNYIWLGTNYKTYITLYKEINKKKERVEYNLEEDYRIMQNLGKKNFWADTAERSIT